MNYNDTYSCSTMSQTNTPNNISQSQVRKRIMCSPMDRSDLVDKSLNIQMHNKSSRNSFKWGIINVFVLLFLMIDISNRCPFSYSKWFYVEYVVAFLVGISVLYHFGRYFYFVFSFEPIKGTVDQKRLLQFNDADSSFVIDQTPKTKANTSTTNVANVTLLSWHSSMNDSNRSISSPGWTYARGGSPQQQTPQNSFNQSAAWTSFPNQSLNSTTGGATVANLSAANTSGRFSSPYQKYAKNEVITDEHSWQHYLKDIGGQQESKNVFDVDTVDSSTGATDRQAINSFWNYCNNAANVLKNSLYQMAPTASASQAAGTASGSGGSGATGAQTTKDELGIFGTTDINGHSDEIKKICSLGHLTQYVYNIRTWIACTVLHRLDNEITKTNQAFEIRGLSDIKIGSVGLDRLKKTADNQQLIAMYAPMLPILVPFLDMSTNQEYLIQRIKDLAKGSVLAEYRWNSGGSYNGLNWDEHLPTDSAIIFHLFCAYLDSQLAPIPQPGGRPFYGRYVVIRDKKSNKDILTDIKNNNMKCAILVTNTTKPKFNFISDGKIHNCVQDRNNLFYVIVEFLVYMKNHNNGLLQGVNLGMSGINILNTIGE